MSDTETGEADAATTAQQTPIPVEVSVPVVPELSGRMNASVDAGSRIRQKPGSTKGVERRTQRLR